MSKLKRIAFRKEHIDVMELRVHEATTIGDVSDQYEALAERGICNTIIYDGRILGVIGYVHLFPDVVEVFILPSKYISQYGLMFAREVQRLQRSIEVSVPIRRMQTASIADKLHDRWMNFLGFTCEAEEMKNFVNGTTYRLWARVY